MVSIYALEDKGMRVAFIKGKVLTWPKESGMKDAFTLGSRVEGIYRVNGRRLLAMVHKNNHQSEIWKQRLAHIHYEALPKLKKLVSNIPNVQANHDGLCSGRASGNNTRGLFPSNRNKTDDIL